MAAIKPVVVFAALAFLVFHLVEGRLASELQLAEVRRHERSLLQTIDCAEACSVRCSKASRQKRCEFECGSCCKRCNCVPPGTYGNKEACPCYASITTHGGKPNCP
ncbi:Gibberellin-regulated protein 9 [Nymphaea thermarum]|nr:Gibberellin-regulated protein 9 [Nymphaea thermarum]